MTQTYSRQDLHDAKASYEKRYMDALDRNTALIKAPPASPDWLSSHEIKPIMFETYRQYYRACCIMLDHIDGFKHLCPRYQSHGLTYRTYQLLVDCRDSKIFNTIDFSMVSLLCQYHDARELFGT